jgi:hypothetical protein
MLTVAIIVKMKVTHLDYGQFHDHVIKLSLYPLHDSYS